MPDTAKYTPQIKLLNFCLLLDLLLFFVGSHAQDEFTSDVECSTFSCSDIASESAQCTDYDDVECYCEQNTYSSLLSSCLLLDTTMGCTSSDWISASSELDSSCSSFSSSFGTELCDECYTSAITDGVSCLGYDDYGCLCNAKSNELLSSLTACAETPITLSASCPISYLEELGDGLFSSCSSYEDNPVEVPGCAVCQVIVASGLQCSQEDYKCLCAEEGVYLDAFESCIDTVNCYESDLTVERDSYTAICSVVATGGTPPGLTLDESPSETDLSSTRESEIRSTSGNDDESDGPQTSTVVGVVLGAIAGLALLLIGGYFIFKKRSKYKSEKVNKVSISKLTGPSIDQRKAEHGVYEMMGSGQYQNYPIRPSPTQKAAATLNHSYELDNRPIQPSVTSEGHYRTLLHQGYVELGPGK